MTPFPPTQKQAQNKTSSKTRHPAAEAWGRFCQNYAAVAALMTLTTIIICAIFGPALYPIDPFDMVWAPFSPPGQDGFLLGTDYLGRDLMAALIHGARVSIMIGFAAAFMVFCIFGHSAGAQAQTDVRTCTQQSMRTARTRTHKCSLGRHRD